jgi:outer membrane protein assembly factor BamB
VVYVGSYDGTIYALNARTGALLWGFFAIYFVYSSPAVAKGVVYEGAGAGSTDAVIALKASTGHQVWRHKLNAGGQVNSATARWMGSSMSPRMTSTAACGRCRPAPAPCCGGTPPAAT